MEKANLPFNPFLGITSGYWQTILGSFGMPFRDPPCTPLIVPVTDNDRLYCLESTPEGWDPSQPTIILVHGLGGSSRSRYMVRLSRYLYEKGQHVVRVNLRGSGAGLGMARKPANAGRSEDILTVCQVLTKKYPQSQLQLIGFSLGGNIVLKMLGELGNSSKSLIERAMAICPSIDLKEGIISIGKPENRLFEKHFVDCLLEIIAKKRKIYNDYPIINFPKGLSLYEFDDLYTAPLSGYKSADDYYEKCSSNRIIRYIESPTTILYSLDDPIIPAKPFENLELSPHVRCYATKHGGHLGYLGWSGTDFGMRWMDRQVIEWLK